MRGYKLVQFAYKPRVDSVGTATSVAGYRPPPRQPVRRLIATSAAVLIPEAAIGSIESAPT